MPQPEGYPASFPPLPSQRVSLTFFRACGPIPNFPSVPRPARTVDVFRTKARPRREWWFHCRGAQRRHLPPWDAPFGSSPCARTSYRAGRSVRRFCALGFGCQLGFHGRTRPQLLEGNRRSESPIASTGLTTQKKIGHMLNQGRKGRTRGVSPDPKTAGASPAVFFTNRSRSVVPVRGSAIPRILADESGVFGTSAILAARGKSPAKHREGCEGRAKGCARLARREEREYQAYLSDERSLQPGVREGAHLARKRSQAGCSGVRMPADFCHGLLVSCPASFWYFSA